MYVILADHRWCEEHANPTTDGWKCKKTNSDIQVTEIRRSLHDGPFPLSGSGRVIPVGHLHCPGCDPSWKGPADGTPIKPEQIAIV